MQLKPWRGDDAFAIGVALAGQKDLLDHGVEVQQRTQRAPLGQVAWQAQLARGFCVEVAHHAAGLQHHQAVGHVVHQGLQFLDELALALQQGGLGFGVGGFFCGHALHY